MTWIKSAVSYAHLVIGPMDARAGTKPIAPVRSISPGLHSLRTGTHQLADFKR